MSSSTQYRVIPPPRTRIVALSQQNEVNSELSAKISRKAKSIFTKSEIARAIDAIRKAGLPIKAVSIGRDGSIRVRTSEMAGSQGSDFDEWQDRL